MLNQEKWRDCDSVLRDLKQNAHDKVIMNPGLWLHAAEVLNSMIGDEVDSLATLKQNYAQDKLNSVAEGLTSTHAKTKVDASETAREMFIQEEKIKQIREFINLGKKHATLKMEEMRAY